MSDKVIIYRSIQEQRNDEMWQKLLDMHPWLGAVMFYILLAFVVGIFGYVVISLIRQNRWLSRRWK